MRTQPDHHSPVRAGFLAASRVSSHRPILRGLSACCLLGFLAQPATAQLLPGGQPTRYVYTQIMDLGQIWTGPTGTWTFTLTHVATDFWNWTLSAQQNGMFGHYGNSNQLFRYTLLSAQMSVGTAQPWSGYLGWAIDPSCVFQSLISAGSSGTWSTAGCVGGPPQGPPPEGWYPTGMWFGTSSTWDIETVGVVESIGCCSTLFVTSVSTVPEPGTSILLATGLVVLAAVGLRRRRLPAIP